MVSPIVTAAVWMGGALLSFSAMAVAGRELASEVSTFQILFYRSLIGLIVVSGALTLTGWRQIRLKRLKLHVLRNAAHYTGQFGWFYGVGFIPLAQVFAIEFTVPVWTAILATFVLGERITRTRAIAILAGFIGILIILRPGMLSVNVASLAVLIAALGFASSHVLTKRMTNTETPLAIIFYMSLIQLPVSFLPALFDWGVPSLSGWGTPSPFGWGWICVIGIGSMAAHYCIARAFVLADATVVVPVDFLRLPLIVVVGFLVYGEAVDVWVLVGAVIIFAGNYLNIRHPRRG